MVKNKKDEADKITEKKQDRFDVVLFVALLALYVALLSVFLPEVWLRTRDLAVSALTFRQYRVSSDSFGESTAVVLAGFIYTVLSVVIAVLAHKILGGITGFTARDTLKWLSKLSITIGVLFVLIAPVILTGRLIVASGGKPIGGFEASLGVMKSYVWTLAVCFAIVVPLVLIKALLFDREVRQFIAAAFLVLGVLALMFGLPALYCYLLYSKAVVWPVRAPYWAQALVFAALFVPLKIGSRLSSEWNDAVKRLPAVIVFCVLLMAFNVLVFQYAVVLGRPSGMLFGLLWLLPFLRTLYGLTGNVKRTIDTHYAGNGLNLVTYTRLGYDTSIGISQFWVALFSLLFLAATIWGR